MAKATNPGSDAQDNKNQEVTSRPTKRARRTCRNCGSRWPHLEGKPCPTWEKNCRKQGHVKAVCRSPPKKNDTTSVGRMTVETEVEEIICRRIASTADYDNSDPILMKQDVKIEHIDEKMNAKPTVMERFPDSGCQETLGSTDLMDHLRLELDRQRRNVSKE